MSKIRTCKHNCDVFYSLYNEPIKWKPIFSLDNYREKYEHLHNNYFCFFFSSFFRFFVIRFKVILELEIFTKYLFWSFLNVVKCSILYGGFWVIYNHFKCDRVFVVFILFRVNKIDLPQQKWSRIWISRLKCNSIIFLQL